MAARELFPSEVKRAVVLGVGNYGSGADIALAVRELGLDVTVTDIRPASELPAEHLKKLADAGIPFVAGENPERLVDEDTLLIPAPSIPLTHPLVRKAGHVLSDMAIVNRAASGPVIGITGTNGKTTTAAWLHHILDEAPGGAILAGNMGIPAGRVLSAVRGSTSPVVLELSSFQAEYLALADTAPRFMLFTNFSPDHLERYASLDDYRRAKRGIIKHILPDGTLILNRDDEVWDWREGFPGSVLAFGALQGEDIPGVFFDDVRIIQRDASGREDELGQISACPLPGRHNLYNLCAAITAAAALGTVPEDAFQRALSFAGVEHRIERVAGIKGVTFYDDSASTTPEAALSALAAFALPPVLIVGGRNKGMSIDAFTGLSSAAGIVLIGETAPLVMDKLGAAPPLPVETAQDMQDAVKKALDIAVNAGAEAVVLSPGFASFDMFRDYRQRGEAFKEEVKRLGGL